MLRILDEKERAMYKCAKCGNHRSVKYAINGKIYCNKCALLKIGDDELIDDLQLEQTEQM